MKGLVVASFIVVLSALPVLFAMVRFRGNYFLRASLYIFGFLSLCGIASRYFGVGFTENLTTSLNGHIYVYLTGSQFQKGDTIAYRWHGGATYPKGEIFIKPVVGMPGDRIVVNNWRVWVNDQFIGFVKRRSRAGIPLSPTRPGIIKNDEYFVATPHPDSLDSRYALSGNIQKTNIIGKAYEVF
jgi:conjugal transfer pilin signal peptidase TrbI